MQMQTNKIRYSIDTEVIPLNVEKEVNEHTKTDSEREKKKREKTTTTTTTTTKTKKYIINKVASK